jgi:hypothetical protein
MISIDAIIRDRPLVPSRDGPHAEMRGDPATRRADGARIPAARRHGRSDCVCSLSVHAKAEVSVKNIAAAHHARSEFPRQVTAFGANALVGTRSAGREF